MLLGLDIGTSSSKAVIIDPAGRVLAVGRADHPIEQPYTGWSQQRAADWWASASAAIRDAITKSNLTPADLRAIGLSGQMHGLVLLDDAALRAAKDQPIDAIHPVLLWNDQRTHDQCREIEQALGSPRGVVEAVGNAALPGLTLPKMLWVRQHAPDVFARVAKFCMPKDFIALQLTGELATDVGDGAGTLLLDPAARAWSTRAIDALRIDPRILPYVLESASVVGHLTPFASGQLGLQAGLPVIIGSGDNQTGAIGTGVVEPGLAMAMLGTSGVIYAHSPRHAPDLDHPQLCGRTQAFCAADGTSDTPGHWSITGCTLSAGGSLDWARDTIAPGVSFASLMDEAAGAPPGCDGLIFLPHLTGERCPHPDPQARGAWIGLTSRHTRAHLIRSVVEGVTFTMAQILDIVRSLNVPISRLRLSGGGSQSAFWRQLQADFYHSPVATLTSNEGSAFGAALLAGVGVGLWPSVREACHATIREHESLVPHPASAATYRQLRDTFESAYGSTAPLMHRLAR